MVRRASVELGLEGTLSIMERRRREETPSKSKSAPALARPSTPARKPSLTRRSSEIRKELLPPGIAGDVVGAMLGCAAAVQKCMPAPPPPPPPLAAARASAVGAGDRRDSGVGAGRRRAARRRRANPPRAVAKAKAVKRLGRRVAQGRHRRRGRAGAPAVEEGAAHGGRGARLGGGRFNQPLVRDPSSGRIVHAPEGGAPAAAETPTEEAERLSKLNDDE